MKGVIYMNMNNLYKLKKTIPEYTQSKLKPSKIIEMVECMRSINEIASSCKNYKNKSSKIES